MTLQADGTVFLTKQRPQTSVAADGTWSVTLHVTDPVGTHTRIPWLLVFSGDAARNWWAAEGHMAEPGDGLLVSLKHMSPTAIGRGWEAKTRIEAHALSIKVDSKARKSEEAAS